MLYLNSINLNAPKFYELYNLFKPLDEWLSIMKYNIEHLIFPKHVINLNVKIVLII